MFKYAFALVLKKTYPNESVFIDSRLCRYMGTHNGYELNRLFDLKIRESSFGNVFRLSKRASCSLFYKMSRNIYIRCLSFFYDHPESSYIEDYQSLGQYNPSYLNDSRSLYYDVSVQAWQYYKSNEQFIRNSFRFKVSLNDSDKIILKQITDSVSVGIHFRGGDYLMSENSSYNVCSVEYYKRAIDLVKKKYQKRRFFVFTNDIDYYNSVKDFLFRDENVVLVRNQGKDSFKDMIFMSKCQCQIIANSSFSWWGAWLNERKDRVIIAPSRWHLMFECKDVCPLDWIRV